MKKRIRNAVNVVLGALSVGMLGCRTPQPKECLYGPPPPEDLYGPPMPEEMIMAKYGPPWMMNGGEPDTIGVEVKSEELRDKSEE